MIDYLKALPRMSAGRKEREIAYLKQIRDESQEDKVKREALVRHAAIELGAFRLLDDFRALAEHPPR